MIWNPFELVSYVSHQMTLLPGDVIATGAPAGAGLVDAGDRVEIRDRGDRAPDESRRASLIV